MLYHLRQNTMRGTALFPLSMLKNTHPDLYEAYVRKYDDRPELLTKTIMALGSCKRSDIVFLCAIHPKDLKAAFLEAGLAWKEEAEFFEIDPRALNASETTVMVAKKGNCKQHLYQIYQPENLAPYRTIPQATKDYYRECAAAGKRPLVYHATPQVLHRGVINVANCSIIRP